MRPAVTAALLVAVASPAFAQAPAGSWEVAPGVIWFSALDLGSSAATLERPGGGEFELFKTETTLESAIGPSVAVSYYLTRRLAIDAAFSYARPSASTRVSDDAEGADVVTSEISLPQYLVEGNLRWYVNEGGGGWRPFLRGGGGYLRQLDDSSAHVETGYTIQAGLGLDRVFRDRPAGAFKRIGVRAEGRAVARSGGFDVSDSLRVGFAAGASLFLGF